MRKQLYLNAKVSVMQTIVAGLVLFVLYRYLLESIGVESLGIWSIILATTSVTRISELGLSGSVVKFVAKYRVRDEPDTACNVIQTAAISICVLIAGLIVIFYPMLLWILGFVLPANAIPIALSILPLAMFSLWVTAISSIFLSGLDGCQRIDLRGYLMIASAVFHLLITFMLVPYYGIMGLAYAQIIQAVVLLFFSWCLIRHVLSELPLIPCKFTVNLFKEMIAYGLNFQIASIMMMLFEPATKVLLSKFGNLSLVGYYEMANRMVMQFRALIISTNQVIVPTIANFHEIAPEKLNDVYKDSYKLILYIAIPFYSGIMAFIPIISEIWIGYYEVQFLTFSYLLIVAWFLNTLTGPAYFDNLGRGRLAWNTISHVSMGMMNFCLGYFLGSLFGGEWVVVASVISLIIGSYIVVIAYHKQHNISLSILFPQEKKWLLLMALVLIVSIWLMHHYLYAFSSFMTIFLCVSLTIIFLLTALWHHPMRSGNVMLSLKL